MLARDDRLLSISEAAKFCGISTQTLKIAIDNRELDVYDLSDPLAKVPKAKRILFSKLSKWLETRKVRAI
jgi:hypothetical protein